MNELEQLQESADRIASDIGKLLRKVEAQTLEIVELTLLHSKAVSTAAGDEVFQAAKDAKKRMNELTVTVNAMKDELAALDELRTATASIKQSLSELEGTVREYVRGL